MSLPKKRRVGGSGALDALGNPIRRQIVQMLAGGECAVADIAAQLPVSRPAVSRHLRLLQDAGLVTSQARGTRNLYRLEPGGFEAARAWLDEFWDQALARFRLVAENTEDPHG